MRHFYRVGTLQGKANNYAGYNFLPFEESPFENLNIATCEMRRVVERFPHNLPFMRHHPNKMFFFQKFYPFLPFLPVYINFALPLKTKDTLSLAFLLILLNGPNLLQYHKHKNALDISAFVHPYQ